MKCLIIGGCGPSLVNFRGPLIRSLMQLGHVVNAAAAEMDETTERRLRTWGCATHGLALDRGSLSLVGAIKCYSDLKWLISNEKPDVMLTYTIKPVIFGGLAAGRIGVPRIVSLITGLGYAFQTTTVKQRLVGCVARRLYRLSLRYSDVVLFQNKDDRREFQRLGLLRESQITEVVNGSGVDVDWYSPAELSMDPITFLMAARLYREKGVLEYVEAAGIVKRRFPNVRCLLVGAPDANPNSFSSKDIEDWVSTGSVEYLGWSKDIRQQMRLASVFVLPSYREGTPRTVLEAMSMGRPVVTTNVPGCRQTVVEGCNGFLVPERNGKALAEAMMRFVSAPSLISSMGRAARQFVEERYDVRKVNEQMIKALGCG